MSICDIVKLEYVISWLYVSTIFRRVIHGKDDLSSARSPGVISRAPSLSLLPRFAGE